MTSIIKLEAVSGVYDADSPPCYLLQVDEFRFLLDCGWDEHLSMSIVNRMVKHVKQIDAVLLSHPDPLHLGALPYLVGKAGLNCPIFATVPVSKMGEMFMYDLFAAHDRYEDFDKFTLEDVDLAFSRITQLKYNQSHVLKGKGQGITMTPLPAGHMIGGTIWKISKDGEEDIIYAIDFNHKREKHLNRCILDSISKPSLLILDSLNALYKQNRRQVRDSELYKAAVKTLRSGGNVLVCVDTAGRCLELSYMLDQSWRDAESGLQAYSLVLLNSVASHVMEFAKSQVEWMSDQIMKAFEGQRNNPFQMKNLHICQDMASLANIKAPCLVLASQPDLESGFARELFVAWSQNPVNNIIITQRSSSSTLASQLISLPKDQPGMITIEISEKMPLQGLELEEYRENLSRRRQEELARLEAARKAAEEEEAEADSDEDEEEEDTKTGLKNRGHDLLMREGGKQRGRGFFKQANKAYPMYPCPDNKVKWDDYGEVINPEDFVMFDSTVVATDKVANLKTETEQNKENQFNNSQVLEQLAKEEEKIPTKCVTTVLTLRVVAKITFIDFEGRSDGESIRKLISSIKPRRLILVKGSPEATRSLASYCDSIKESIFLDKVFTPRIGDVVDATTESHIYQVKLKDSLVSSLKFQTSKDGAELAWIDAEIEMPEEQSLLGRESGQESKQKTASSQATEGQESKDNEASSDRELLPTLTSLPPNKIPPHVTIFVNELKLSDFKQILIQEKIHAEFLGGVLYCNNQKVALKRSEAGRIQIEGTLCQDYFKIRDLLYKQYAIL